MWFTFERFVTALFMRLRQGDQEKMFQEIPTEGVGLPSSSIVVPLAGCLQRASFL